MHAFTIVGIDRPKPCTDMGAIPLDVLHDDIQQFIAVKFEELQWKDALLREDSNAIAT